MESIKLSVKIQIPSVLFFSPTYCSSFYFRECKNKKKLGNSTIATPSQHYKIRNFPPFVNFTIATLYHKNLSETWMLGRLFLRQNQKCFLVGNETVVLELLETFWNGFPTGCWRWSLSISCALVPIWKAELPIGDWFP